jgi:hypothetical protein
MLKPLIYSFLFFNYYVFTLNSNDICIKSIECDSDNSNCGLKKCNGTLSHECNRLECTLNKELCEEYQDMVRYMNLKKSIKLDKLKTLGSIRGVQFVTKNLRKFVVLHSRILLC